MKEMPEKPTLRPQRKPAKGEWSDQQLSEYQQAKEMARQSEQISGTVVETGEYAVGGVLAVLVRNEDGELKNCVFFSREDIAVSYQNKANFDGFLNNSQLGSIIISDLANDPAAMKEHKKYGDRAYITVTDQDGVLWSSVVSCKEDSYQVSDWINLGQSKAEGLARGIQPPTKIEFQEGDILAIDDDKT